MRFRKPIFVIALAIALLQMAPSYVHAQATPAQTPPQQCFKQEECGAGKYKNSFAVASQECTGFTPYTFTCISSPPAVKLNVPLAGLNEITGLQNYIAIIYKFLIGSAGILAGIMIVIAGFEWLTAAGDSGKIKHARERITKALIGLVLALGSYTILYTINPALLSLQLAPIKILREEAIPAKSERCTIGLSELTATANGPADRAACALQCGGADKIIAYQVENGAGCCSCKNPCAALAARDPYSDRSREAAQPTADPLALESGYQYNGQRYYIEVPRTSGSSCVARCSAMGYLNPAVLDPCTWAQTASATPEEAAKKTQQRVACLADQTKVNVCCQCSGDDRVHRYDNGPGDASRCQALNDPNPNDCRQYSGADGLCAYGDRRCTWAPTTCSSTLPCPNPASQQCIDNKCVTQSTPTQTNCAAAGVACGSNNNGLGCCSGNTCITRTLSSDYCRPDTETTKIPKGGLCDKDSDCSSLCNDSNEGMRLEGQINSCGSTPCNADNRCNTACNQKRCK